MSTATIDLGKLATTLVGVLLISGMGWMVNSLNGLKDEAILQTYKLEQVEKQIHAIQLTDPTHDPAKCSICLHIRMMDK